MPLAAPSRSGLRAELSGWSQGVVFDDGMLVFGVRQGWAGVVGVAPEVGDPVAAQGGRQV